MTGLKSNLGNLRTQAQNLVKEPHVSTDIRHVIDGLLEVIRELERQLANSGGQSGDIRVLRSRYDRLTAELVAKDREVTCFKKKILEPIILEIHKIISEVNNILVITQVDPDGIPHQSAKNIMHSLKAVIESLSKS